MRRNHLLFFLLIGLIFPNILNAQQYIIISEIMYDTPLNEVITSPPYSNGEYIELYNSGDNVVNLNGWKLKGGGVNEIYNFENVTIPSKSYLILAYQHKNKNTVELFYFDHLYSDLQAMPPNSQIIYQNKIVLSNSGESVVLQDANGFTKDSIYYDGTSNKSKPNRLFAENKDGIDGLSCISLQRVTANFDNYGNAITNNSDWKSAIVNPLSKNSDFISAFEDKNQRKKVSYSYDVMGNRTNKDILIPKVSRKTIDDSEEEAVYNEMLSGYNVLIYPNPTKGDLNIRITTNDSKIDGQVTIYNMNGQVITTKTIKENQFQLDLYNQLSGLYIMKIDINGEVSTWKIIKE